MDDRTGFGEITKRSKLLATRKERKMWRAIVSNVLNGQSHREREECYYFRLHYNLQETDLKKRKKVDKIEISLTD